MDLLLDTAGNSFFGQAKDVSGDGSRIVGVRTSPDVEAFLWEQGVLTGLGFLSGGGASTDSFAEAISADGSVIVGSSVGSNGREAFRWKNGVMIGLGLPGLQYSAAFDTSGDGNIVVGNASILEPNAVVRAWIWDQDHGMRFIEDVLANDLGLDLTGWTLDEVFGISADGRTIVGDGINPQGQIEAWIAVIPEPSTGLLVVTGLLGLAYRQRRRGQE